MSTDTAVLTSLIIPVPASTSTTSGGRCTITAHSRQTAAQLRLQWHHARQLAGVLSCAFFGIRSGTTHVCQNAAWWLLAPGHQSHRATGAFSIRLTCLQAAGAGTQRPTHRQGVAALRSAGQDLAACGDAPEIAEAYLSREHDH